MGPGFLNILIYDASTTMLHNYAEEHIKPRIQLTFLHMHIYIYICMYICNFQVAAIAFQCTLAVGWLGASKTI